MKWKILIMILLSMGVIGIFSCKNETKKTKTEEKKVTKEYYVCPMHTEVKRADSGNCNKCGRKMVKVVARLQDSARVEE